jgi:hypothetical protein
MKTLNTMKESVTATRKEKPVKHAGHGSLTKMVDFAEKN